jgi:shikimate kinase
MKTINRTRDQINQLDQQIAHLLRERFSLLDEILAYKVQAGEYIENPLREKEVLEGIIKENDKYNSHLKEVYQKIIEVSKYYQWNDLLKENIYIIGFMAVGKTTLGKTLAEKIQWDFLDTDLFIEAQEQRKIKEIFKESGEDYFRSLEAKLILNIHREWKRAKQKKIIACGGGIILNPKNVENMRKNGMIVHLEGDIDTIYNRLILDDTRPLLAETRDLRTKIANLLENRRDIYNQVADISLFAEGEPPENLVKVLIRQLEDYERKRSLAE